MNTYTFIAADKTKKFENGEMNFYQAVQATVYADTEEEALKEVKRHIKRKTYLLKDFWAEKVSLHDEISVTAVKQQSELLKLLGKASE